MTVLTRGARVPAPQTDWAINGTPRNRGEDRRREYLRACPAPRGQERFSFPQLVTLYQGVTMRTRSYWCPELETLSVNALLHARGDWHLLRTPVEARRVTRWLAEPFAREILAPCAGHAWNLSIDAILEALTYLAPVVRGRSRGRP